MKNKFGRNFHYYNNMFFKIYNEGILYVNKVILIK